MDVCTVGLWRAAERNWQRARQAGDRLALAQGAEVNGNLLYIPVCQAILAAAVEARVGVASDTIQLARLDSLAASSPPTNAYIMLAANLTVARLREARGDIAGALAAVRRRSFAPEFGAVGLSTYLREEGRLAERRGEHALARAAYEKYLSLRTKPDEHLQPQVQGIRAALDALMDRSDRRALPR
jgi:hypothetical protein